MRKAIYTRVSSDESAAKGYSVAEQKEACTKKAIEMGATLSELLYFSDEGVSGINIEREGLENMRKAAMEGLIDAIIILDPDRLSRKLAHQLLLTEEFERLEIQLVFVDFTWENTPEGRLFYSIKGAFSEYEREKIRLRMMRGKKQKALKGLPPMGVYHYGYDYDPDTAVIKINENEAEIVLFIYNELAAGRSSAAIALHLTAAGIPTKKNTGYWHRQVVRQILLNPAYKGEWHYKHNEQTIIIPIPAIIESELWDLVQSKLKDARRLWSKQSKQKYLLSGIISCSDCATSMTGIYANNWGRKYRGYTCRKSPSASKKSGCNPQKIINAESVEYIVWDRIKKAIAKPEEIVNRVEKELPGKETLNKELGKINKKIIELEKGRGTIIDALTSGVLGLDEKIKNKLFEIKNKNAYLLKRKDEIIGALEVSRVSILNINHLFKVSKELLDELDELEFEEKKKLLRSLVSQIIIVGRTNTTNHKIDELPGVEITIIFNLDEMSNHNNSIYF